MMQKIMLLFTTSCLMYFTGMSQQLDLVKSLKNNEIEAINRQISAYEENAIELDAQNSDGLGILKQVDFETGTIELDVLGENKPGSSFVGIAFNIQNDSTYEAVYFRPFNFNATEQIRRDHMVQYIAHPEFTWNRLRNERTGEFENEIQNPPHPDAWFRARIEVLPEEVKVYIEDRKEPVLSVKRLSTNKTDTIGLWTGFGSSGRFRNMVITPSKRF